MKVRNYIESRIRGWLPQEPKLPGKYAGNRSDKKEGVLDKPLSQLSLDTVLGWTVGFLLILLGIFGFIFNDFAFATVQNIAILLPVAGFIGYFFFFWIGVGAIIVAVIFVANHTLTGARLKRNLTKRRLLPYGVAAILFAVAYLYSNSTMQFGYAIPIAFVVSGVLAIWGLKKFAVTLPAFAVLLISMLVLGCVMAGPNVVTYSSESRVIAFSQVPNINAINITARSVEGDVRLYFVDNSSEVCNIQYLKEYGLVTVGTGTDYNGPSAYANETAPVFYYYVTNGVLYVIADSFTTVMNITVNRNLLGNFSLYTYFGDVSADVPPDVSTVQTLNLTSIQGTVNLKISNTNNLRYVGIKAGSTAEATIASNGQMQDSTFQLTGGTVRLNLQVSNLSSQITARSTNQWGTVKANTQGFNELSKTNLYFKAQTPNYGASTLKKLDVDATATQSANMPALSVTATSKQNEATS